MRFFGLRVGKMSGLAAAKRRKELRKELALIEKQIFDLETTYLEETRDVGNIFLGWGAYASEKPKGKKSISNDDRLFSLSSQTSPAYAKQGDASAEGGGAGKKRKNQG